MYHNTKQALLAAFDLRGVKCKGMTFDYISDYPTVNRYTTEPSSFDERLAQDAMVRRSIREAMTEEEYLTLMFCYTQNLEDIERSWINAVYPAILKTSKIAKMISGRDLLCWAIYGLSQANPGNISGLVRGMIPVSIRKVTAADIANNLGVSARTVYRGLNEPVNAELKLDQLEDRVSELIHEKGWYIGENNLLSY